MPKTKKHPTPKSSRLGERNYKVAPPLRFVDIPAAKEYIKVNKLKVTGHVSHTRGYRVHVVDRKTGKLRTLSITLPKEEVNDD